MEDKNKDISLDLYEKMYFYEVEVREKLVSRLQFVLAIIVSLVGGISYIILNLNQNLSGWKILVFHFLLFLQLTTLTCACFYFAKGWTGHEYFYIPDADELEQYKNELEACKTQDEANNDFFKYIKEVYQEASTKASQLNKKRLNHIHKANIYIILSVLALFLTFLWFVFAKLDKSLVTPVVNNPPSHIAIKKEASSPDSFENTKAPNVIINNTINNFQGDACCQRPKTKINRNNHPENLLLHHRHHKNLSCGQ